MFQWDPHNLRKIEAHQVSPAEAEQMLLNDPILIHEENMEGEARFIYYGETEGGRLLAAIVTERSDRLRVVTGLRPERPATAPLPPEARERRIMMPKKIPTIPKFKNESQEADWWASPAGRNYVERKSVAARAAGVKINGSSIVARLNKKSVQIAIRLPEADLAQARKIAEHKGVGYQTLLKMLVHEGLAREARR